MDDYREYVNAVAKLADGKEIIQNKTPAHAGVLIAALFRKASAQVQIVSGCLDARAFDSSEVIEEAKAFLSRPDTQLTIVLERPVTLANCKFLASLHNAGMLANGRVNIHLATGAVPFHFLLADEKHYRFEADPARHEAIAQFGASSTIELRNAFKLLLDASQVFTPA